MAIGTITNRAVGSEGQLLGLPGDLRITSTTIVGDSSYPTGGTAITAAQLGLNTIVFAQVRIHVVGANGPVVANYTADGHLKCYSATGEVANTTDLSAATIGIVAWGY